MKRRHSMGIWVNSVKGFCQNIHHVILICMRHLPASCNRNFFARIFPACPIVLGTTMQSLKSWCFHKASSDVFRGVSWQNAICFRRSLFSRSSLGVVYGAVRRRRRMDVQQLRQKSLRRSSSKLAEIRLLQMQIRSLRLV